VFTIRAETCFKATHQLRMEDGSKEPPHEHDWYTFVDVSSERLDHMGLVMDFNTLKRMIDNSVFELTSKPMEEIPFFASNNQSAENVARFIFEKLEPRLPLNVTLKSIRVFEQQGCSAKFTKL